VALLDAAAVARLLHEIGQRMELLGEAPFKSSAYLAAAETLEALGTPLDSLIAQGRLRTIPGIGEAIAEKIIKLHKTGSHPTLDYLREQLPAGVLDLLRIPGLGPKKATLLYKELNVASLDDLEAACKAGRVAGCKNLGAKLSEKILPHLDFLRQNAGNTLLPIATEQAHAAAQSVLHEHPGWQGVTPAGSLRRGCEIVNDVCLVAQGALPPQAIANTPNGVRIVVAPPAHYAFALLFNTGNSAHLEALCRRAEARGLSLRGEGLFKDGQPVACADEQAVYAALGLQYIEPELREGRGEIERAEKSALPALVSDADIRGILHSHSTYSDGAESVAAMAEAVRQRGYQYYGIADHSQLAAYANGLKEDRVRAQHREIDALNQNYRGEKFRVFKGIESDIREDGSLDYPEAVLARFDFIVASVHSRFSLDKKAQTARIINAVKNPRTTILGHMTGRLLLRREGYQVDMESILKACADHGVAVEVNAHPQRLDLDWRWHQRALELGCLLSINPDAHSIPDIDMTHWGVLQARKGGVPPERVLNCLDLDAIARHFAARNT
jgi:DNA polymerase (family 10)